MQTFKYLILSLLLMGIFANPVKATNLSKEEIEAIINKSFDERFAKLQKHINRNVARRLVRSPIKLLGVVGLVSAWGYWFVETHSETCKNIQMKSFEYMLALVNAIQPESQTQDSKQKETKKIEALKISNSVEHTGSDVKKESASDK